MKMAQGITFDLKARVTGYESSLEQLKRAFDKIDPGSEIGKKLSKAIQDAENKLKGLNKNLNPKATNDNQIDSIIEKTNAAAEAIQNVAKLMQNVSGSDVDFSSFNNGIKELVQQLNGLQEELEGKISGGLKTLISDSNDLSEALKVLGINVEDKDRGQIFTELQDKAEEAAEKTKIAVEELQKAQNDLSKEQVKLTNLESNPLNNRDAIKKDLSNLTSEYIKAIEEIKNQVGNNLTSLLNGDSGKTEEIMNAFMNGLTPETLSAHLKTLKDTLQSELKNGMSAKDIYKALLGDYGNAGNAQAIATKLIQAFDFPGLKEQFRQKIYEISSELTDKETGQLLQFIKESDFQAAEDKTVRLMESHAVKLQGAITKAKQAVKKAAEEVGVKEEAKVAAEVTESGINTIISTLQTEVERLSNENSILKEDIKNLQEQIAREKSNAVNDISDTGGEAELDAESFKISAEEAAKYHHELDQVRAKEQLVGKVEGLVQRWFSIYAAVNMVNKAIHSIISTVKELDKTITEIAIVTDMTQDDLWGQMSDYTEMARQYAASISGVYQVSQLYYQQGLQTADVMALTEETLKMARISGLGYAEATDYMTNAVRSFKMEMTDAQRVVDVYSEIAASSATSTTELATAMSKTASSAEAVGSSFENTTAMMAVMIEATRESATNIGSAMKSIISRYGEMTSDPSKLTDSEGEEMSLNKVDKALQSVGITIQDANHQFREFDDVIAELAGKWDTIDNNTQRYIATVMAGNRQQSRFLALVSNGERLAELSEKAADAEDAATLQVLKTMDSIEAKTQQLQTSLQSLYTSTGVQNFFKGILDVGNNIINTFTKMPTTFNLPILAVTKFGTQFLSLANIVTTVFSIIKSRLSATEQALLNETQSSVANSANIRVNSEQAATNSIIAIWETMPLRFAAIQADINNEAEKAQAIRAQIAEKEAEISNNRSNINAKTGSQAKMGLGLNIAGAAISMLSSNMGTATNGARVLKGSLEGLGSALQGIGMAMTLGGGPLGIIIGALTIIPGLINSINTMIETAEEKTERLAKAATEANNAYIQQHNATKTLQEQIDKLEELEKAQYDSEEARQAFIDASNEMAEQHPELISAIDSEGNAIVDLQQSYLLLAEARDKAADAAKNAAIANNEQAVNAEEEARNNYKEKARIEIGNFNDRVIESRQKSYEEELSDFINNDNVDYFKLLKWIRMNAETSDQNNTLNYLAGQGVEIDDKDAALKLFQSIGEKLLQGIEAVNPSSDLKMGDYLADAVKNSEFLSRIIEAMDSENNVDELQKIFSEENFVKNLEAAKTEVENSEDIYVKELVEYISQLYNELLPEEGKVKQAENKSESVRRSGIANSVRANLSTDDFPYLNEIQNAFAFITEAVYESSEAAADYDAFLDTVPDRVTTLSEQLSEIWKNLTPSEKDNFNTLIANAGHYNEDNFREILNQYIKDDEELTNAIIANLYNKVYNIDKFKNAVENLDTNFDLSAYNDLLNQLGSQDLLYILDIYKNVDKQIQSKTISQDRGNEIIDAYMSLFTIASSFGEDFAEASQLISGMSEFSLAGIAKFQESVNNSGLSEERMKALNDAAEELKGLIPINLNTEINTFVSSVTEGMSDFESALNKATKGMNYKDAAEIAGKMGVSISEFRQVGTKFFIDDLDKLKDAYIKVDDNLLKIIDDNIISIETALNSTIPEAINSGFIQFDNLKDYETEISNALENSGVNIDIEQLDISTKYQEWLKIADETEQTFIEYIIESLNLEIEQGKKVEEIVNRQIAENYLANGNFIDFLNELNLDRRTKHSALKAYNDKDLDALLAIFPESSSTLIGIFENLSQNIYNNILNGITSNGLIQSTKETDKFYQKYVSGPDAILEQVGENAYRFIGDSYQVIIDDIKADETLTDDQKNNLLKTIHTNQFKDNVYTALNNVIDKFDSFSYEAGQALATALGGDDIDALIEQGIITEDTAGNLSTSYEQMRDYLNSNIQNMSTKQYNDLRAKLEAANYKQSDEAIFANIIKNRESLSEQNIADLANMLGYSYSYVANNILNNNGNGTYSIDLTQIQTLINQGRITVTDEMKELMANEIDNVISSITGLVGSQSKGYTNLADMQKFVNNLNKTAGSNYGFQDLFEYSDILHAYQLSAQGIIAQVQTMKRQLSNMTKEQQEVAKQLIADTARQFAEQIDISSYISAIGTVDQEDQWDALQKSITDYNNVLLGLADAGEEVVVLNSEAIKTALEEGGLNAVEAARKVADAAGKTLTADEVEAAYRSEVGQLTAVFEQLVYEPGTIIDNAAADILDEADFGIKRIEGTNQALITKVGNINKAYVLYLEKLRDSSEATLVDLNEATAMVLETNESEKTEIIEALGKAASMTYSEFANILTKAGIELTEDMINQLEESDIIKKLGGGKMQIIDFKSFADLMHWDIDANSEEYVSAFKAYNDALIELNRKTEKTIADEIHSIGDAKAGDQINLTQLSVKLGETALDALAKKLRSYGADLSEGILTLGNNANIPAIIQEIAQEAANKGLLLEDTMAELADTLNDVLENYVSLIGNGIDGKLTNSQAQQLQTQATSLGFKGNLDFSKTADGLKLSEQSAASLYNHLKSVDTIKSRLVLDKLYKSITSSNDKLKTMSSTMVTIDSTQKKIKENEERIVRLRNYDMKDRAAQIQKENDKLKDQLNLYKDIRMEQMGDPESYAFMDQDLPDAFKGPQNYWNSVGKAFTAINQAGESGYMEIADFYNFINEATNLVSMSGQSINLWGMQIDGSAETAANLIERGFGALSNIDGEGVKVDLKRLGANFKSGADGMANDFAAGIKIFAKSQIDLIDAEIAMLETFVVLQDLDKLDTDNDDTIELIDDELVKLDETGTKIIGWSKKYTDIMEGIKNKFKNSKDKDIQNAWNNIKINGHSLDQLFSASTEQLKRWGISLDDWEKMLNGLNKLVNSDKFADKPEELMNSITDLLSEFGLNDLDITYDAPGVNSITLVDNHNKFGLDFDSASVKAAQDFVKKNGKGKKDSKKALEDAFEKYESGTADEVDLESVLIAKGIVEIKDDGTYVNGKGPLTNDNDIKDAIAQAALGDIGAYGIEPSVDLGEHTFEGKIKYGNQEIRVTSDGTSPKYYSNLKGMDSSVGYNSLDDLFKAEFTFLGGENGTQLDFESWVASNYGLHLDIKTTVDSDLNLSELRQKAIEVANMPLEKIKEIIEPQLNGTIEGQGTVKVDINGVQMTIQNKGTIDQKAEAIASELASVTDPDGLISKISTAITNSLKNINLGQLILDGLLNTDSNTSFDASKIENNPKLIEVGRQLGLGISKTIKGGVNTGLNGEDGTEGLGSTVASSLQSGETDVQGAAESVAGKVATPFKNLIDPGSNDSFKIWGMTAIEQFVDGFNLRDSSGNSSFVEVFGKDLLSSLRNTLTGGEMTQVGKEAISAFTDGFSPEGGDTSITAKITTPIYEALRNLFSKETLDQLCQDFKTNSTIELSFDSINVGKLTETVNQIQETIKTAVNSLGRLNKAISELPDKYLEVHNTAAAMDHLHDKSREVGNTASAIDRLHDRSINLRGNLSLTAYVQTNGALTVNANAGPLNASFAKGNINKTNSNFNGGKKTLVGELGPELVVSNGRYYVVGQNGAEMVNLPDDAIVFNHLQTKKLLGNGKSGRGKPVTNEKNAVSYATGNVSGPALASASSVLAALKELRAMWESMLTASAKQLGSQAGKSKDKTKTGSSKGDNGDGTTTADDGTRIKTTTAEIQRWYNLLRQIDKTEKDITYQEKLQTQYQSLRVADGKSLYKSYKTELSMLEDQIDRSKELAELQKSWYDTKRAELAASAYGKIFTYTEDGLQQSVSGANKGLDILEKLTETDIWGNPTGHARTAATQLSYIQSLGFDLSELLSNSDGTKVAGQFVDINTMYDENGKLLEGQDLINAQVSIMENFWDNIDGWRNELDSLYDSYREQLSNVVDNQNKQNEIMQKIVDNQIEVENKVYDALVDARQATIDNAQKEMDTYQKNSDEMIDSLNKTLDKERQLYDNQKNSNDLLKLQRQLAILQRSGGSTSQILSLQQQIATKQQDMYFDEKEEQIKALQEASDLQLEKMQEQVDLMSETLEYQKENGLLWKEVYAVMQRTPEDIIGFITNNAADWGSQSAIQISQNIADLQTKIQLYTSSRDDDFISYYNDISSNIKNIADTVTNNNLNGNTESLKQFANEVFKTSDSLRDNPVSNSKPTTTTTSTSNNAKTTSNNSTYSATSYEPSSNYDDSSYSSTARLTEGSTTVYKKSGDKFVLAHKSMGKTGAEVTILEENAGYYNSKQISQVEYKGKKYYIRNERLAYKQGGLIDFTGPTWVDGTPSQPESILNANETKFVQNKLPNILNSVDTLQERLKDLQTLRADWLSSISHVVDNSNNQNSSVNIEHVELNMNVEQMSSSADAKKLGREAFDELLNMARKAGKNSVSRR